MLQVQECISAIQDVNFWQMDLWSVQVLSIPALTILPIILGRRKKV